VFVRSRCLNQFPKVIPPDYSRVRSNPVSLPSSRWAFYAVDNVKGCCAPGTWQSADLSTWLPETADQSADLLTELGTPRADLILKVHTPSLKINRPSRWVHSEGLSGLSILGEDGRKLIAGVNGYEDDSQNTPSLFRINSAPSLSPPSSGSPPRPNTRSIISQSTVRMYCLEQRFSDHEMTVYSHSCIPSIPSILHYSPFNAIAVCQFAN